MVPQPYDFVQFWQQLKWFVGAGPQPRFEHFTYWEKFDYWAVMWGTALMGAAGLVLWFPEAAAHIMPAAPAPMTHASTLTAPLMPSSRARACGIRPPRAREWCDRSARIAPR